MATKNFNSAPTSYEDISFKDVEERINDWLDLKHIVRVSPEEKKIEYFDRKKTRSFETISSESTSKIKPFLSMEKAKLLKKRSTMI